MDFPKPFPHDPIREVFPDVFFVTGKFKMAPLMTITRNMVIVRHDGELTLVNALRLTEAGEREMEALGDVKHVIKLGDFHTRDDPYVLDRYRPTFWALRGARHRVALEVDVEMDEETEFPVPGASLFVFREARRPEGAVVLDREGGILITCDSVQSMETSKGMSLLARLAMKVLGFSGRACVGPMWRKTMELREGPSLRGDFERLLEHSFKHLLSGHGPPVESTAHDDLRATVARLWPPGAEA